LQKRARTIANAPNGVKPLPRRQRWAALLKKMNLPLD
jgi:hypothetical protein